VATLLLQSDTSFLMHIHKSPNFCYLFTNVSFLCGKGPRSRSYGHTAALRLIVLPSDGDEENDDQFFIFASSGAPVE
jgi:hypothetical protein